MNKRSARVLPLFTVAVALALATLGAHAQDVLKKEPAKGELRYGRVVLVDDGSCPPGQIRELTGGSVEREIPRKSRCVKRPAGDGARADGDKGRK
jgi:hypothetical protein